MSGAFAIAARTNRYWAAGTALLCLGGLTTLLAGWSLFWPLSSYQVAVAGLLAAGVVILLANTARPITVTLASAVLGTSL